MPLVHVIEDDPGVLAMVCAQLEASGYEVLPYSDGQAFLDAYRPQPPECLVLDLRLPQMSGLELQRRLLRRGSELPVIVVTGFATAHVAVQALKLGAEDFLEKPYATESLLDAVQRAITKDRERAHSAAVRAKALEQLGTLTPREFDVFRLLVKGSTSKAIAYDLRLSKKTVDMHRSNLMHKLQARSLVDLFRLAQVEDPDSSKE